jgi:hypothetical protein
MKQRLYNSYMPKKPLNDDERQAFIDNLPKDEVNSRAKETFEKAIERAAKPKRSKPERPAASDGYSDTQTHSHKTEDTSG